MTKQLKLNTNSNINKSSPNENYKYLMVFLCFLFQTIPFCLAKNVTSLYIPELGNASFNGTFTIITICVSITGLIASILSPVLVKMYGKIKIKLIFIIGLAMCNLGFMLAGLMQFIPNNREFGSATTYFIAQLICQIGTTIFSGLGLPFLLGSWFNLKKLGLMMGIAFMGGSTGNIALQPLVSALFKSSWLGYSVDTPQLAVFNSFFLLGGISFVITIIPTLFFIKTPNHSHHHSASQQFQLDGVEVKNIFRFIWWWVLILGFSLTAISATWFTYTYTTFLKYNNQENNIGFIGMAFAIGAFLGNVIGGHLWDKLKPYAASAVGTLTRTFGLLIFMFGVLNPLFFYIGIFFIGSASFIFTSGPSYIAHSCFGPKQKSLFLGLIVFFSSFGFASGGPLGQIIAESSDKSYIFGVNVNGNWLLVFVLNIVVACLGSLLLIISLAKIKTFKYNEINNYLISNFDIKKEVVCLKIKLYFFLKKTFNIKKSLNIKNKGKFSSNNQKWYLERLIKNNHNLQKWLLKNIKNKNIIKKIDYAFNMQNVIYNKYAEMNKWKNNFTLSCSDFYLRLVDNYYLQKINNINQKIDKINHNISKNKTNCNSANLKIKKLEKKQKLINNKYALLRCENGN